MDKFCLVINNLKEEAKKTGDWVYKYLSERGKQVTAVYDGSAGPLREAECVIVFGGDGTLLGAADAIKELNIPILGINLGTLGFLAETEPCQLEAALDKLLKGDYTVESRMMLEADVVRSDGRKTEKCHAVNDVVLTRGGLQRPIGVRVLVNGRQAGDYFGDGMMVSTPTGSTGYNLSAGGPIVVPKAELMLITPICAHSLNARTIIVSDEDEVVIKLTSNKQVLDEEAALTMDGNRVVLIHEDDTIIIKKAACVTKVIKFNDSDNSFFDILRTKFGSGRN